MTEEKSEDTRALLAPMSLRQLLFTIGLAAGVGLVAWGLTFLLDTYVLQAIFCQEEQARCGDAAKYSEATAGIVAGGIALFGLVKLRVMRPLIVVVATTLALWGFIGTVASLPWHVAALASAGMYAVTYALFGWIARLRLFWVVMLLVVAALVAIRLGLSG